MWGFKEKQTKSKQQNYDNDPALNKTVVQELTPALTSSKRKFSTENTLKQENSHCLGLVYKKSPVQQGIGLWL